jgi:hypothetical protein
MPVEQHGAAAWSMEHGAAAAAAAAAAALAWSGTGSSMERRRQQQLQLPANKVCAVRQHAASRGAADPPWLWYSRASSQKALTEAYLTGAY